uniref:Uncharacterized protein n=1 Tax=Pipistrellus kuhlii TaxID=59472 RepID=A0A7J7VN44_PIPKU|nr:hypothetical protein mPipKuh1_008416 [Pipistrellus kuhlii]
MGTAVPVVPSSAGAACTVAGIVNPLIRCQCCPAVPRASPHPVSRAGPGEGALTRPTLCRRRRRQSWRPVGTRWRQESSVPLPGGGGRVLSLTANWVFLLGDWSFISFPFPSGLNAIANVRHSSGKGAGNTAGSMSDFRRSLRQECKHRITTLHT